MLRNGGRIYIYEWSAWNGYLLPRMFPRAVRISARLGESHRELEGRLPDDVETLAFHLNLTDTRRTPAERQRLCESLEKRGVRLLNAAVTSISKHDVQNLCARLGLPATRAPSEGDPEELLVVKTSRNYGGESESRLSEAERRRLGLPLREFWSPGHSGYRRLRRREVKPESWDSPEVIVERWVENRGNVFYRAYVLGSRLAVSRVVDPAVFKKMPVGIRRESWFFDMSSLACLRGSASMPAHVAQAVARFSPAFRLDFGALDLVEDDAGRCYIIDVNTTPYWGDGGHADLLAFLASGL